MVKKDEVATILKDIEARNGVLTPDAVVTEARDEFHPLHNRFDWNDETAGAQWRLQQARQLINEVKVIWRQNEIEQFHNVEIQIGDTIQRGYVSFEKVMSTVDLHKQVLKEAAQELEYWQDKYKTLREFRGVVNQRKLQQVVASL